MSEQLAANRRQRSVAAWYRGTVLLAASALMLTSCSKRPERPALPTFPVTGQVVTSGERLPIGGCVEFESKQHGLDYTAMGVIDSEGKFALSIPFVDRVIPGATEGPHAVRVMLPIDEGGGVVRMQDPFVVQPRENHFTIDIPKKRKE
jgi:hypothetical protein